MGRQEKSQHDSATAFRMKQEGIERKTGRCPFCHRIVAVPLPNDTHGAKLHVLSCGGRH